MRCRGTSDRFWAPERPQADDASDRFTEKEFGQAPFYFHIIFIMAK
jgi:hypothetical protein